jgi:hypothetical protein
MVSKHRQSLYAAAVLVASLQERCQQEGTTAEIRRSFPSKENRHGSYINRRIDRRMRRRLDRFGTRPRRRWRWRSWRSWWRKCWCQQQRRNFFERFGHQRRKRRYGCRRKSKQSERCCHVSRRISLYDGDSTYTDHPKQSEQPTEDTSAPPGSPTAAQAERNAGAAGIAPTSREQPIGK